jgi:dihydroflavonol-4-reductase
MNILITGITGLFGSYLAHSFARSGQLYGLKRRGSSLKLLEDLADQIIWVEADLFDIISLEETVAKMDLVIHAAGVVSFSSHEEESMMKTNVEGTTNLVNAMLASGKGKLIHISSVAALGRAPGDKLVNENNKWTDSDLNTPYALSKYLGELEVWRGIQEGLQAMVVHPSVLLGKISDQRSSTVIYHYVLEEKKFIPAGKINYLDVRDAAEIVYQLYHKQTWGERFILNHQAISYKEFFDAMAVAFGKKPPTIKLTRFLLQLAIWISPIAKLLRMSRVLLNSQTAKLSQIQVTMDNSKVQQLLGFVYTPLEETLQWAKSNEKK